jgi:hypothetical protein
MPDEIAELAFDVVEMCLHQRTVPMIWLTRDATRELPKRCRDTQRLSRATAVAAIWGNCTCDLPF